MKGGGLTYFDGNFDAAGIKQCLQSPDPAIQMAAVKQVIANMTVGKDQTSHFHDVARLVTSQHQQVKKLVYLYLMQNAKSQPEKAVMHAGSFVRDANHESPLIRGLALRTMTSLQVSTMTPFANEVVMRGLRDSDPYVRRNAALGVVKLYQIAPEVLQETGRVQDLLELLADPYASVVAAAVSAVAELIHVSPAADTLIQAIMAQSSTLVNALSECGEWSQMYLLQGISLIFQEGHRTGGGGLSLEDGEGLVARVVPFLQSNNPAVVIATVNIFVNFLQSHCNAKSKLSAVQQAELENKYANRIAAPLVSLVSSLRFELRYVALRNIRVIVQRYKDALVPHIKAFLVKYDDPIYIKLEKVDVMVALATRANAELILAELVEYAAEVDIELVRKAVRSIGVIAVKLSSIAAQCVERLVALIDTRVTYIVQEAAVVVQNILRQYPATYEAIIVKLCKALDVLDDPESKAAVVWVIGEYADRIDNVVSLIKLFFEGFNDETLTVQLAILTATVKVYFAPSVPKDDRQAVLEQVLALSTGSAIPDLRDRAYFYWRLILADPPAAERVVKATKDKIVDTGAFDRSLLTELLRDVGRLSSVLHRPVNTAVEGGRVVTYDESDDEREEAQAHVARERVAKALDEGNFSAAAASSSAAMEFGADTNAPSNFLSSVTARQTSLDFVVVLDGQTAGKGLTVAMAWEASTPLPRLHAKCSLSGASVPSARIEVMQLNVNCWGLSFAEDFAPADLTRDRALEVSLAVNTSNQQKPTQEVQVAVQAMPMGVLFFVAPPVPPRMMMGPAPLINPEVYADMFTKLPVVWTLPTTWRPAVKSMAVTPQALKLRGLTLVHRQDEENLVGLHLHGICINGARMFAEVTLQEGVLALANVKTTDDVLGDFFGDYLVASLTA